jgi:hypothetical protein
MHHLMRAEVSTAIKPSWDRCTNGPRRQAAHSLLPTRDLLDHFCCQPSGSSASLRKPRHVASAPSPHHRCRTFEELVRQAYAWFAVNKTYFIEMRRTIAKAAA